ncbi:hypothetical protein CesoFtcFv8_021970 [Champsocephalus esox]|uniref:Uncharacterized protein n=1 Tax=Champsocephalus esox TaxID=159716 RepID=A0AAN8BAK3_9TELE|nr:hypothetical protein CesoFtcFv8_021970 [Champsocephalus esox]
MPTTPKSAIIISESNKPGQKMNSNKKKKTIQEKVPVYEADIPEPTCRAELLKYWKNFSLDDKTANKLRGFPTMGLKCYVGLRRFVLSWIDQRDTSTLHRFCAKSLFGT